jgi:leucyl-tRNA synthetase
MIYCQKCGIVSVPEKDLPVLLPENAEFKPTGESPLKYNRDFVNTACPRCGGAAERETDTMDTFMCSSWYFLRYTSPNDTVAPFDIEKVKCWMPVDLYTGGAEHAVMHLLYARFFTKALRDIGLVDFGEPFTKLFNQGVIIAKKQKMSKSRGNVINPDVYVLEMGADTVRAYLMFVAPWEQGGEWNDSGISGISRWLNRLWKLVLEDYKAGSGDGSKELQRITHQTIKKVSHDLEKMRFNTMISALMEYTNHLNQVREAGSVSQADWKESIEILLLLLAPTTPHLTEELWQLSGNKYSIHNRQWPVWDEKLVADEQFTLVVQINGKMRDRLSVPTSISEAEVREAVMARQKVHSYLDGKQVIRVIYIPGRLINLVVK